MSYSLDQMYKLEEGLLAFTVLKNLHCDTEKSI